MKNKFHETFGRSKDFPVLNGCDDFIDRLSKMKVSPVEMMQTVFVSSDFEDAYTNTSIDHIQKSIEELSSYINLDSQHSLLIIKLLGTVFRNCYFYTPTGLYRQTKGMPMGDISSRDALDIDLVNSEIKIIQDIMKLSSKIHVFSRLVDDVSVIAHGRFKDVKSI